MKKGIIFLLLIALVVCTATIVYAEQPITILVDGKTIASTNPPQIIAGRTFVPLRVIAEALGTDVNYDPTNRAVLVTTKKTGQYNLMTVNGQKTTWPYWVVKGEVYMEYRNLLELLTMYTTYSPQNVITYIPQSNKLVYCFRTIEVNPISQGDFTTISLDYLKKEKVVDYDWNSTSGSLTLKPVK